MSILSGSNCCRLVFLAAKYNFFLPTNIQIVQICTGNLPFLPLWDFMPCNALSRAGATAHKQNLKLIRLYTLHTLPSPTVSFLRRLTACVSVLLGSHIPALTSLTLSLHTCFHRVKHVAGHSACRQGFACIEERCYSCSVCMCAVMLLVLSKSFIFLFVTAAWCGLIRDETNMASFRVKCSQHKQSSF